MHSPCTGTSPEQSSSRSNQRCPLHTENVGNASRGLLDQHTPLQPLPLHMPQRPPLQTSERHEASPDPIAHAKPAPVLRVAADTESGRSGCLPLASPVARLMARTVSVRRSDLRARGVGVGTVGISTTGAVPAKRQHAPPIPPQTCPWGAYPRASIYSQTGTHTAGAVHSWPLYTLRPCPVHPQVIC